MSKRLKIAMILTGISIIAILVYLKLQPLLSKNYNSTSDIITAYILNLKSTENIHASGDLNINITSEDMSMPVKLIFDMKTNMKDKTYTETTLNMSMFGMPVNSTTKTYTEKEKDKSCTYTSKDDGEWTYEVTEITENENTIENITELKEYDEYLKNIDKHSEFIETKEGYEIKIDLSKLKSEDVNKLIEFGNKKNKKTGDDSMFQGMMTSKIGKLEGNMTAKFDKKAYLTELEINECKITTSQDESSEAMLTLNAAMEISAAIKLSEYDKVDENNYTVPDEVKKKIKKEEAIDKYSDTTQETKEGTDNNTIMDEWGNVVDGDYETTEEASVLIPTDNLYGQNGYYIIFGSSIVKLPASYNTLKDDGWKINLSDYDVDEEYELEPNDRINGNLELYNKKYTGPVLIGFENRTEKTKKILNCDIWSVDISYNGESTTPISINGLTWNASENDVYKVLGKCDYSEEYGDGTVFKYLTEDGNLNDTLEIYITNNRLTRVRLIRE